MIAASDSTAERWAAVRFRYAEREFVLVGPESRSHALSECERICVRFGTEHGTTARPSSGIPALLTG